MTALMIDLICGLELERLERTVLGGDQQLTVKGAFGGAAVESFFRGKPGKVRIVIFLGKMREHDIARAGIEAFRIGKILADRMIREMSGARENALLDDPRIRPDLEHVQIVIRFEQQAIRIAKMNFDEFRHVAEVGHESHLGAIGAEREADGIGSVVRNLKRVNIDIADGEVLAGLYGFHASQTLSEPIGQGAVQRVHGLLRNVKRSLPQAKHLRKTVAVIEMLVGDEDAVNTVDTKFDGCETRQSFAFAEATVHQESGALRLEQCNVARAA
jgi:hypothetical protein